MVVSASANQVFKMTASAQYAITAEGWGSVNGSFDVPSGVYTMSGTFTLAGYTAPAGLDGGKLYLDLSQTGVNYDPLSVTPGTCQLTSNKNSQCGAAPSFTSTPSSYILQISAGARTVSFPVPTISGTNVDISLLAGDFVAGHPLTITVVQKDVFTPTGSLTDWFKASRTDTVEQGMQTQAYLTVHGQYTPPPPPEEVPEPLASFLAGGGLVALGLYRRFNR